MRYPTANREQVTAPTSKFRVIAVDVKDACGTTYLVGDFDKLDSARVIATERSGVGSPVFIYNDAGKMLVRMGSWH